VRARPKGSWKLRYVEQAIALSTDPDVARAGKAIALFHAGLALAPRLEWDDVFPNDFAAIACLARALRQLRAALLLMMARMGHDSERAAMIYLHEMRGADRAIARAIDAHVNAERQRHDDDRAAR
jgi:hypothetical protein